MSSDGRDTGLALRLGADRPAAGRDEDELESSDFVERLALAVASPGIPSSFVLGLYGGWGQGKTSLLKMLEELLGSGTEMARVTNGQSMRLVVIRFNPWLYDDVRELLVAFFRQLKTEILTGDAIRVPKRDRAALASAIDAIGRAMGGTAGSLERYVGVTTTESARGMTTGNGLASAAIGSLPGLALGAKVGHPRLGALTGAALSALGSLLTSGVAYWRSRHVPTPSNLEAYKRQADRALRDLSQIGQPLRVVVLVDDLDRAAAPEILAMLRLVNLIADLPFVTYVLAMDDERVRQVLARQGGAAYGADFLDKIVQVPIRVPPVPSVVLKKLVLEGAQRIAEAAGRDASELTVRDTGFELFENEYWKLLRRRVRTLRDRVRLLNAYRVMMTSTARRADLHAGDALLVAFLQAFMPAVYAALPREEHFLLGNPASRSLSESERDPQKRDTERQARLDALARLTIVSSGTDSGEESRSADDVETARRVLRRLFPHAIHQTPERSERADRAQGRISAPEFFLTYFRLARDTSLVPESMVAALVSSLAGLSTAPTAERINATIAELTEPEVANLLLRAADRLALSNPSEAAAAGQFLSSAAEVLSPQVLDRLGTTVVDALMAPRPVNGEPQPPREDDALSLAKAMIEALPVVRAVELAYEYSLERNVVLHQSPMVQRELARAGLKRVRTELARIPDVFQSFSLDHALTLLRNWRYLMIAAGLIVAEERSLSEIGDYLEMLLVRRPAALSEVLSLVAGNIENPRLGRSDGEHNLNVLDHWVSLSVLRRHADAILNSHSTGEARFPSLIHDFVRLYDEMASRPPEGTGETPHPETPGSDSEV